MPSVDTISNTVGEVMVASGAICLKIETWTHGEIGWGVMSCIFVFAFLLRKLFAMGITVLFFTAPAP